jgi:hypothetical protein
VTILDGHRYGLTKPDDLTHLGNRLFVAFQNGVPSTGAAAGTPQQSTVVEFTSTGSVKHRWSLVGKCDGLAVDAVGRRLVATVNEDGNSSLYTIPLGGGVIRHYRYDANPLPHGGGTDSVTIYGGHILLAASAPGSGTFGPAVYRVTLSSGVGHLAAAPFFDASQAVVVNGAGHGTRATLAWTDPDSGAVVPAGSPRFAGAFELTSQGDKQAVFAAALGTDHQQLWLLRLTQSVDDTAFDSATAGALFATDPKHDSIVRVTGGLHRGVAYAAVTPGNANDAPANPVPNYLGSINLFTGKVSAVTAHGVTLNPQGLMYVG